MTLRKLQAPRSATLLALVLIGSALQAAPGNAGTAASAAVVLDDAAGAASWGGSFSDAAAAAEASL
jgi:hypothetical protein